MATRKPPSRKASVSRASDVALEPVAESAEAADEALETLEDKQTADEPLSNAPATVEQTPEETHEHQPRFHFFLIDAGWKSASAKVIRDNFHMIREFQNSDPLFVLSREQSVELIRDNPELIGKDPIIIVHDLHAKGGRGESGYHGFRLCLGLIKDASKALDAMQEFLRFVHQHRRSADIEKDIRRQLHHAGLEGALEVIREGAGELME